MPRTLNSPIADPRSEIIYLYEINHSGGVIRITTAAQDITALTFTWTAAGGSLIHSGAPETGDRRGQGAELILYGVDQTIIQLIQNNQFRGYLIKIYLMHRDPDTGVQDTPDLIFQGRQNGDYKVVETRDHESTNLTGGTVTVSTFITADLASVNTKVSTRCTVTSHEEMLRRSGVASPDDKFFERLPGIIDKDIFWGIDKPETGVVGGGGTGGGTGGDGPEDFEGDLLP